MGLFAKALNAIGIKGNDKKAFFVNEIRDEVIKDQNGLGLIKYSSFIALELSIAVNFEKQTFQFVCFEGHVSTDSDTRGKRINITLPLGNLNFKLHEVQKSRYFESSYQRDVPIWVGPAPYMAKQTVVTDSGTFGVGTGQFTLSFKYSKYQPKVINIVPHFFRWETHYRPEFHLERFAEDDYIFGSSYIPISPQLLPDLKKYIDSLNDKIYMFWSTSEDAALQKAREELASAQQNSPSLAAEETSRLIKESELNDPKFTYYYDTYTGKVTQLIAVDSGRRGLVYFNHNGPRYWFGSLEGACSEVVFNEGDGGFYTLQFSHPLQCFVDTNTPVQCNLLVGKEKTDVCEWNKIINET